MRQIARWAAVFGCLLLGSAAASQQIILIENDIGGFVETRATEVRALNEAGARVEIRGDICLSSCTMYLGARNLCISPATDFGFHGPSFFGASLPERDFEYWSEVIASHYSPPLRDWFMREARYRQIRHMTVTGQELIRIGYPAC